MKIHSKSFFLLKFFFLHCDCDFLEPRNEEEMNEDNVTLGAG